jgi:hypothetical protein
LRKEKQDYWRFASPPAQGYVVRLRKERNRKSIQPLIMANWFLACIFQVCWNPANSCFLPFAYTNCSKPVEPGPGITTFGTATWHRISHGINEAGSKPPLKPLLPETGANETKPVVFVV